MWQFQVFCLGIIAVVALTTFALRRWKGRLQRVPESDQATDALQFGIKSVLIWTTVVAILFGIGRSSASYLLEVNGNIETFLEILGLAMFVSVTTVFNIWALLNDRISPIRIGVLVCVGAVALVSTSYLGRRDALFPTTTLISQLQILLTMFLLRMQRFRFVARGKRSTLKSPR